MKTIFLTLCFVALIIFSGLAQTNSSEVTASNFELIAQKRTIVMSSMLNLSSPQKDSVEMINKEFYRQISLLRNEDLTTAERGKRLMAIDSLRMKKLEVVLTSAQWQQYQQSIEALRNHKDNRQLNQESTNKSTRN